MHFQIREVVLWPRDRAISPRIVRFQTGTVNVITGASQTGKSAIVPIIDYCLGSGKCSIPTGIIRSSAEWFGVVIETARGQLLLARREPGVHQSTGDMFMMESDGTLAVPEHIPSKNTNREFVKDYLDELGGLTSLDFDPVSESGFKGRPSFRDMAAFNFQPQNIIANPEVLFLKLIPLSTAKSFGRSFRMFWVSLHPKLWQCVTGSTNFDGKSVPSHDNWNRFANLR
jgi:hypothetical protein